METISEIFRDADTGDCKVRVCVGLVLGSGLYLPKKFGAVGPSVDVLTAQVAETWERFPRQGLEEIQIFGWQLGAPYEVDDQGETVGSWPQAGTLLLPYHDAFLMPSGELPARYAHLRLMRLWCANTKGTTE